MDEMLEGEELSNSKPSEAPSSPLATVIPDETSNESAKLSQPITESESLSALETSRPGNLAFLFK